MFKLAFTLVVGVIIIIGGVIGLIVGGMTRLLHKTNKKRNPTV